MIKNTSPLFIAKCIILPKNDNYFSIELINAFSSQNFILLHTQFILSEEEMKLQELIKMLEV